MYKDHGNAAKYGRKIDKKAEAKVACVKAIVVPVRRVKEFMGLRIAVGVGDKTEKLLVIHNFTSRGSRATAGKK